jgi:hypothetical protein
LLVLHAVRLLGFADEGRITARFDLDREEVSDLLGDFEAVGWIAHSRFAGLGGWALTDRGQSQNGRQLADELEACGAQAVVAGARAAFDPLNARFLEAVTRWQLRPVPGDPLAANDHTDPRWDDRVIDTLTGLGTQLAPLCTELSGALTRFDGYQARYAAAVTRVEHGQTCWVDTLGIDSCHGVWMQLHEDLLATLGLDRGAAPSP